MKKLQDEGYYVFVLLGLFAAFFAILKIIGAINVTWCAVLSPIWIPVLLIAIIVICVTITVIGRELINMSRGSRK